MKFHLTILFLFFLITAFAQNGEIILGNRNYKEEKFNKAEAMYRKSLAKKNSTEAKYNLGNSLYKQEKTEDAIKAFDEAAAAATTPEMKAKALYNKAVLYHKANKLDEAIEAYKTALRLTPNDAEIRKNLQLALSARKKKQPEDQKKQKPKEQPKQEKKQQEPPTPKPQQSKLNKKQAEQYLKALEEKEKQLQEKMRKKGSGNTQPEKDW